VGVKGILFLCVFFLYFFCLWFLFLFFCLFFLGFFLFVFRDVLTDSSARDIALGGPAIGSLLTIVVRSRFSMPARVFDGLGERLGSDARVRTTRPLVRGPSRLLPCEMGRNVCLRDQTRAKWPIVPAALLLLLTPARFKAKEGLPGDPTALLLMVAGLFRRSSREFETQAFA